MKYLINLIFIFTVCLNLGFSVNAQENTRIGFISDDLFLYFHSGPGTQYRILGSINAGEEVQVISELENEYIQIEDSQGRKGWIDAKYLSDNPGLRIVLAELNEELANKTVHVNDLTEQLNTSNSELASTKAQLDKLKVENADIEAKYAQISTELDNKDLNTKMTYFKYGAAVLVFGLLFGLLIPRLIVRKANYSSWN